MTVKRAFRKTRKSLQIRRCQSGDGSQGFVIVEPQAVQILPRNSSRLLSRYSRYGISKFDCIPSLSHLGIDSTMLPTRDSSKYLLRMCVFLAFLVGCLIGGRYLMCRKLIGVSQEAKYCEKRGKPKTWYMIGEVKVQLWWLWIALLNYQSLRPI